jgi:DNA-binding FrmR family transcriptional regulator
MTSSMKDDVKSQRLRRLSRIEGQIRGIARMVDDDRYCIDILTQISAAPPPPPGPRPEGA